MGSQYAPPQQTQKDSQEQNSRRHRYGVIGANEGTVASRIKGFNEREARSEGVLSSREPKMRASSSRLPLLPILSIETAPKQMPEARSDTRTIKTNGQSGEFYDRSIESGQSEGEKVRDYPNKYEDQIKASWDSTIETRSLRRVASQHSVRYSKPVPTTPTTERNRNGSFVLVGAKARSNVEATSPYAVQSRRDLPIEPEGQRLKRPMDAQREGHHATQDQAQGHESVRTNLTKGASHASAHQRSRSFIPVYRKEPVPKLGKFSTGFVHEVNEFGEEIGRISTMLDIMAAEHFHYIQRIATQLSEGCRPLSKHSSTTKTLQDLSMLILLIEFYTDTWVDSQTRRSIESSAAIDWLPPPSVETPLPLTAPQSALKPFGGPPHLRSTSTLRSWMDSKPECDSAQCGHMITATTKRTVTFDSKPLITPLRLT